MPLLHQRQPRQMLRKVTPRPWSSGGREDTEPRNGAAGSIRHESRARLCVSKSCAHPGAVLTTDASTICTPGYASSVRDVSTATKAQVYAEYGVSYPQPLGAYEVDHFIPLEIGGSNDLTNLWPEPATPTPGFHQKDQFENFEHGQVCDGTISVAEAQRRMVSDWYLYWEGEVEGAPPTTSLPVQSAPPLPQAITTADASAAYYTSSYHTAKYWYPASCSGWQNLSKAYLETFPTLEALLAKYPSRAEDPGC